MRPSTPHPRFWGIDDLTPADAQLLLAGTHGQAAGTGADAPALRQRHVALLSERPGSASAAALAAAATALGAAVVHLRPSTLRLAPPSELRDTARVLGRLYCLIGFDGLDPAHAAQLARWAGVPMLNEVAAPTHPARLLADVAAMQASTGKRAPALKLGVVGDPGGTAATAWQRVGELTGLQVLALGQARRNGAADGCDFVYAAPVADRPSRLPRLAAVKAHSASPGQAAPDIEALRNDSHARVVQALLRQLVS